MKKVEIKSDWKVRRAYFIDMLGGACVKCGVIDGLEFDHIDPKTVSFRLCGKNLERNLLLVIAEVKKCQLLCRPCHQHKTNSEYPPSRQQHGTLSYYMNKRCRCDNCKLANTTYIKGYRKRLSVA